MIGKPPPPPVNRACSFYRDSGWVRLWNANPSLLDPDLGRAAPPGGATLSGTELLQPGLSLRLGPVYTTKYGDTLTTIAGEAAAVFAGLAG